MLVRVRVVGCVALLGLGCSESPTPSAEEATSSTTAEAGSTGSSTDTTTGSSSSGGRASSSTAGSGSSTGLDTDDTGVFPEPEGPWGPGTVFPTPLDPNPRGFLDRRGLVHTHSIYSHDACDEMPHDGSFNYDQQCLQDLREALCETRHDFVFFTDHTDSFADNEYPDVLLFDEARGDALVERQGMPTANRSGCEATRPILLMAGVEGTLMPVGLDQHVPARQETYGALSADAVDIFQEHGGVVLVSHTEDWTPEQLIDLGLDGFEMFNLHANLFVNIAAGAELIGLIDDGGRGLPHPDLAIFPLWSEDEAYTSRWGSVLARGHRRVTTMGTDAHRNSFPQLLPDGERVDSFRRMMLWFSNHLLVEPGEDGAWDDRNLKEALRAGRLYGAFEYLGYPVGFDAHVDAAKETFEIGARIPLGSAPRISATAPTVRALDPAAPEPEITLHVMRAIEGGFEEVASGESELDYTPTEAGAYRVEVRMTPLHLEGLLGNYEDLRLEPRVWVYANPFYVEG